MLLARIAPRLGRSVAECPVVFLHNPLCYLASWWRRKSSCFHMIHQFINMYKYKSFTIKLQINFMLDFLDLRFTFKQD